MEIRIFESTNAKDLEAEVKKFLKPSTNVRQIGQSESLDSQNHQHITLTLIYTENA